MGRPIIDFRTLPLEGEDNPLGWVPRTVAASWRPIPCCTSLMLVFSGLAEADESGVLSDSDEVVGAVGEYKSERSESAVECTPADNGPSLGEEDSLVPSDSTRTPEPITCLFASSLKVCDALFARRIVR